MRNPAKDYLEDLVSIKRTINSIQRQIIELDIDNKTVRGISYDKVNVQSSPMNTFENNIIAKVDLENSTRLANLKRRYEIKFELIVAQINMLDRAISKQVLLMKYVDGKSIRQIANETHYEEAYIINVHGRALQEFRKMFLN